MFNDEVSPEDLFNMFFGGGGGGMGGGGMRFASNGFGPGGMRFTSFGGGRPNGGQARGNANAPQQSAWVQLLPLILLVAFSVLTQLPSLFGSAPIPDPNFSFDKTPYFDLQRQTHTHAKVD